MLQQVVEAEVAAFLAAHIELEDAHGRRRKRASSRFARTGAVLAFASITASTSRRVISTAVRRAQTGRRLRLMSASSSRQVRFLGFAQRSRYWSASSAKVTARAASASAARVRGSLPSRAASMMPAASVRAFTR